MSKEPKELELLILPVPGGIEYQARDLNSPDSHVFSLPASLPELEALWRKRSPGRESRNFEPELAAGDPAREIGAILFRALFGGNVGTALQVAMGKAEADRTRLRLRLRFGAPELAALPWELLYDPNEGCFLFRSPENSLVRSLDTRHGRGLAVHGQVRMLLVKSSPKNLDHLELDKEISAIRAALRRLTRMCWLAIDSVEPDLMKIAERLARHDYHIVHFLGHGGFRQGSGGELFLEGKEGASLPVPHDLIGELLKHESIRLVVLNACNGAQSDQENPFSGVAQKLAQHGVPAVIAMQTPVNDEMAILFAEQFYTYLAKTGRPGQALSFARQSLSLTQRDSGWAIPAFYLKAKDGRLFDPKRYLPPVVLWPLAVGCVLVALIVLGVWIFLGRRVAIPPLPPPRPSEPPSPNCPSPRELGMIFVEISAGKFWMGSAHGEDDSKPPHEVTISKPFCLEAYEVTQKQYRMLTGFNRSRIHGDELPVEK